MTTRRGVVVLALSLALAGCGLFSKSKSRFYSLDRIAPAGAVAAAAGTPVGIDVLEVPPGFDRRDIIVRKEGGQLDVRSTEQWSANLGPLVLHTLSFDLADRLPQGMVIPPGAAKPLQMRGIDVVFEELVAGPENRVTLEAQWTLRETGRADVRTRERLTVDIPSLDSQAVATGTSQVLAALADRIAAGVSGR